MPAPSIEELKEIQKAMENYLDEKRIEIQGLGTEFYNPDIVMVVYVSAATESLPQTIILPLGNEKTTTVTVKQMVVGQIVPL